MTPSRLMRTLLPSRLLRSAVPNAPANTWRFTPSPYPLRDPQSLLQPRRSFAHVHDLDPLNRDVWFTSSVPHTAPSTPGNGPPPPIPGNDPPPPDERTLRLGKTVRTLHDRLPTLLQSPLPSDILSPQISLHLFPSTHPHLPTVSGRLGYVAALWTAPVAWGRMPLIGNVQLTILSERMVRNGCTSSTPAATRDEKLIVKWKTCGKTRHRDGTGGVYRGVGLSAKDPVDRIRDFIAGTHNTPSTSSPREEPPQEFTGIFVFEFDALGRIAKHVIEHTEEGGHWDQMPRVVSVTDWLLGRFNGRGREREQVPELAWCEERPGGGRVRIMDRTRRWEG